MQGRVERPLSNAGASSDTWTNRVRDWRLCKQTLFVRLYSGGLPPACFQSGCQASFTHALPLLRRGLVRCWRLGGMHLNSSIRMHTCVLVMTSAYQ